MVLVNPSQLEPPCFSVCHQNLYDAGIPHLVCDLRQTIKNIENGVLVALSLMKCLKGEHGRRRPSLIVMLSEEGQQISLLQVNFMSYNNSPQKSWPIHDSFSHHQSSCMSIISSSNVMNQDKTPRCPFINLYNLNEDNWPRWPFIKWPRWPRRTSQQSQLWRSSVLELRSRSDPLNCLSIPISQWFIKLSKVLILWGLQQVFWIWIIPPLHW